MKQKSIIEIIEINGTNEYAIIININTQRIDINDKNCAL